jgi:hypothetical protein
MGLIRTPNTNTWRAQKMSCLVIFDRSARCVAPSRLIRMAIDGGISRMSSQSVSDRRRLRCLASTGKVICWPGPNNSYIATLVERHTRYVMLANVAGKDTQTAVSALIKTELYRSLTWDRGKELTDHRRFTLATNIDVYFCDPQSPWQRGSNENTNGLLRQYLPKGTDLSVHSQAYLNKVARQLNERPRETLQFEPQQRDLTPVLRRPVGPAPRRRTSTITASMYVSCQFESERTQPDHLVDRSVTRQPCLNLGPKAAMRRRMSMRGMVVRVEQKHNRDCHQCNGSDKDT